MDDNKTMTESQEESSEKQLQTERFSPEEERKLLTESNTIKSQANKLFTSAHYDEAIQGYDRALSSCPLYLEYEIAVLRSNISACHLQMKEWKEVVESATKALDALDRLDPPAKISNKGNDDGKNESTGGINSRDRRKEIATVPSIDAALEEVDDETAQKIEALNESGHTRAEVQKLRTKVLLRRAKARLGIGGWSDLQGAEDDYKMLSSIPNLAPSDKKTVDKALQELPSRLETAKQKEMSEMMGKLKDLGNGILKPFGLSTDNFNFIKDEKSGGYNMQFQQGGSKK